MKPDEVAIHARVIARRAEATAAEAGVPVKSSRVTEYRSKGSHTVTITVTMDARAVEEKP